MQALAPRRRCASPIENARIEPGWPDRSTSAPRNPELAVEVAQCQRLVKGYSDTHERGLRNYETLMAAVRRAGATLAPATLRELREAALADEHGKKSPGSTRTPRIGLNAGCRRAIRETNHQGENGVTRLTATRGIVVTPLGVKRKE